jgi:hypothetical protein
MDEDMSPRFFALASSTGRVRVERGKLERRCRMGAHGWRRLFRRER